ncbi:NAD-dependent epimerase/dehydratase family protein [Candidatus Microgenomates bacterium]|nr:MAG: NAD-dependent epimerase/dehydratase family protein [Candidatus Microgenomates bacterium]
MQTIKNFIKNKKILVIGGTGSWGSELTRQLISDYKPLEVRIFSRGEHKQVEMKHQYKSEKNIKFIIGDVKDVQRLDFSMQGIDIVFNLAALKHVPVCEENAWEAIQTNIHGAHNIVTSALKNNVKVVVQVSTDKAVDPFNLYGFTKGCAEKLITSANFSPGKPRSARFVCVRAGNVLNTAGSVIPLFKYLIQKHNKVTITDTKMSRYFMRLEQAIQLVLKAATESIGGEIFVMKMPGVAITDLAEIMIKKIGNKKTKIENIGMRPGEKLYEVLVSKNESPYTVEDGKYYIIIPGLFSNTALAKKYKNYNPIKIEEYNSKNTNQLDKKEILKLLEEDNWLEEKKELFSSIFSPYPDEKDKKKT